MKKRRGRKLKSKLTKFRIKSFLFLGSVLVFAVLLLVTNIIVRQLRPAVEFPGSEMKRLPEDVKKSLKKTELTPAFSGVMRVPILLYHYVEYIKDKNDTIRFSLNINPAIFELQILTLKKAGYTFLTVSELSKLMDGNDVLPAKPIILTFDDGHWDIDTVILPILRRYNVKATAYVVPGFIGDSDFMTKKQLREVIDSGLIEIGAHTVNHISLGNKFLPIVKYQVEESKKMLEREYNIKVSSFAYPNGSFDQQAIETVKKAGFTTSVSTIPGIEQKEQNRFFLYRLRPGFRTGDELIEYLQREEFKEY